MDTFFTPEILNVVYACFGAAYLLAVVWLVRSNRNERRDQNKPYETMTSFIQESQSSLGTIIRQNSESLDAVREAVKALTSVINMSDTALKKELEGIGESQLRLELGHQTGVLVDNQAMEVVLYSESVLDILGWEKHHLPSKEHPGTPALLTVNSKPLKPEMWPPAIAMREGRDVVNVPIQVYNERERVFRWVLVSAYPCLDCGVMEDGEQWATVIIRQLESLGSV